MKRFVHAAAAVALGAAMVVPAAVTAARADSIASVVGARSKARSGAYLTEQNIEKLDRWGGDTRRSYGSGYGYPSTYAYGGGYPYGYGYGGYGYGYGGGYGSGFSVGIGVGF